MCAQQEMAWVCHMNKLVAPCCLFHRPIMKTSKFHSFEHSQCGGKSANTPLSNNNTTHKKRIRDILCVFCKNKLIFASDMICDILQGASKRCGHIGKIGHDRSKTSSIVQEWSTQVETFHRWNGHWMLCNQGIGHGNQTVLNH